MQYASRKLTYFCALFGAFGTGMSCWNIAQAALHTQAGFDAPISPAQAITPSNNAQSDRQLTQTTQLAAAQENQTGQRRLIGDWLAVSDADLAELRGGFDTDAGLKISFGIQRAVQINGNLVTTTSLNIPDIGKLTTEQAKILSASAGSVNLIQNGLGNTFEPGPISQAATATVIQNTLNNQSIKNLTVIDATANSLGLLKSINFQSTLKDALSNAAGAK